MSVVALLVVAWGIVTASPGMAAETTSTLGGPISRTEVISRAKAWYDHNPGPYDQNAFSTGPSGDGSYRHDCSGYVSMALHLAHSPSTGELPSYATEISRTELKPGDFLNRSNAQYPVGHTFIFEKWDDDNGNFSFYSWGATPIQHGHTNINNPTLVGWPNSSYRAYRYNNILEDAPRPPGASLSGDARAEIVALQGDGTATAWFNARGFAEPPWGGDSKKIAAGLGAPNTVRMADLDGDGRKEFISVQPNGDIVAWYNALGFAEMPWGGDSKKIGVGFTDPSRVFFADLSGDGKAEIIVLQPDGVLTAWYNALGFEAMPWGASKTIGTGFSDPARIRFADLSGDGKAEIMSIQPDGTITAWYNALGFETMPWGAAKTVGTGFTEPSRVLFADISGDGKAEIVTVQPDGTVTAWYNALGFETMPWGPSATLGAGFPEPARVLFS
ncbi:hypothetical protein BKN51_20095 [Amycolatopsis sp. BJA-103]|uniref:FG-GAP repeat domain-containing protein n=2 Tax=Amycolatopsis sp. BJA-103 TaxID=1911175 RepID=UPI000CA2CC46|nr:VCBS repeat-containing protein [Amycolatopsis sp. BJA-103]AUI60267.1 hypothetical protein BKN51_20095 [Amycolatopsis sp. BJA-103]